MITKKGNKRMNLHEYQAKEVLLKFELPIPPFVVINSIDEVEGGLKTLNTEDIVLKVQVHAGGRGKAGGVKLASGKKQVKETAANLLGMKIVNEQTGKEGVISHQIIITPKVSIEKEYYLAVTIDRANAEAILMVSSEGGVEIEEVAKKSPEKILKVQIPLNTGLRSYQKLEISKFLNWQEDVKKQGEEILSNLVKAFFALDASILEVNPLVLTKEKKLLLLDTKLNIDDNALFRHQDLKNYYDPSQISSLEVAANKADLAYIALEGTIGCMVNGAGLAMATMDIIEHAGGKPANFLDVGGGASEDKVKEGFKIILSDPKVKAILVNIFGGIMNCETLAKGIVAASLEEKVKVPLIVRMEGTNVDAGRKYLKESGLKIEIASDLKEAAKLAVEASCRS